MIYLKTRDVADFLGYKETDSVIRLIASGRLPCERRRLYPTRIVYRPTIDELRAYCEVYEPAMLARVDAVFHVNRTESAA